MLERKRMLDELESQQMAERMQAYSNYHNRQQMLKKELNMIHADALSRQIESSQRKRAA